MSDQAIFDAIRKGKGKMPPEDDARAKNDEIKGLVTYIRKFAREQTASRAAQPPAATPAPSATHYFLHLIHRRSHTREVHLGPSFGGAYAAGTGSKTFVFGLRTRFVPWTGYGNGFAIFAF